MITFKLKRDEARLVRQYFIPYMHEVTKARLRSIATFNIEYLTCMMLSSLIQEVQKVFDRKLLNSTNNLGFKFNNACGIAFYYFLMDQPIDVGYVYAINLRQKICDEIHAQILKPVPLDEDYAAVTLTDYEMG